MSKKKNSKNSQKISKQPTANNDTQFGRDLIDAAKEILAHVKGEKVLPAYTIANDLDVRAIRLRAKMSQAKFARTFCLNFRTLQDWEQGRAHPDSAVRAYLTVIDRNRDVVMGSLQHDSDAVA